MAIHFEAGAVRHKEMKDYFTVMIPLTYQKVLSLSQDWYNIRALSYIVLYIDWNKKEALCFLILQKKNGMKKHCWLFTFSTSSLIHRQSTYGKMQHLITRGGAYWPVYPCRHLINHLEGISPNVVPAEHMSVFVKHIKSWGGTSNEPTH